MHPNAVEVRDTPAKDDTAREWRERLETSITEDVPEDAHICLSGGVDSGTLLAAMLGMGRKPICWGFRLGTQNHPDLVVARRMAQDFGLQFRVVDIPRNEATLLDGIRRSYQATGLYFKTAIECAHPMLRMGEAIAEHTPQAYVVFGTGGVVEDNRTVNQLWHKARRTPRGSKEREAVDRARRHNLYNWRGSATGAMVLAVEHFGLTVVQPFANPTLGDFQLSLTIDEVNTPKQKGIALRAYPAFWRRGYYRSNSSLQVATGVREWHATLLQNPQYNPQEFSSMTPVYRRMFDPAMRAKA